MSSHKSFTRSIISGLGKKVYESSASLLGVRNRAFRAHLSQSILEQLGRSDSVFSDPVIEPTFSWTPGEETLQALRDSGRISKTLFSTLTSPHPDFKDDYTFPADRKPYYHQLEAWEILGSESPRSLLVTSGTGSGKTETFMVPILDDLARQIEQTSEQLVGVQALFLYPLNALIESQKSRLVAWSEGMQGKLRFGLYTGSMPEVIRNGIGHACEVKDRKSLREAPPPLLITNMTMLEYMLIRGTDAPILEKSRGKLKWIVLDEAHTHIGSNAAEVALLLRRTLHAFGVTADSVRFVATSATFGNDPDSLRQLRHFLADMGGIRPDQVNVVTGKRDIPALPAVGAANDLGIDELEAIDPELEESDIRYRMLAANTTALAIRNHFLTSAGPDQTTKPDRVIGSLVATVPKLNGLKTHDALRWLDLLSSTRDSSSNAFLPFRIHLFQRSLAGLSCCVNAECDHRSEALRQPGWNYGQVWLDSRPSCPCGSPVLSIIRCRECSEVMLSGQQLIKTGGTRLEHRSFFAVDEFELDDAVVSDDADAETDQNTEAESAMQQRSSSLAIPVLVTPASISGQSQYEYATEARFLTKGSHTLSDDHVDGANQIRLRIYLLNEEMYRCPCCQKGASSESRIFAPIRISAIFAVSNTVATLLETCPPASAVADGSTFFEGRKLIAFNDSRQGTAQLALKVRLQSERAFFRSFVYDKLLRDYLTQPAGGLSAEETAFYGALSEKMASGTLSAIEKDMLGFLTGKQNASSIPVYMSWSTMAGKMCENPRFSRIRDLYRENGFPIDSDNMLASVMLRREFQRRPKNANNLESMGLVRLSYPGIDNITAKPAQWRGDLKDYKDYLKILMDFFVRESSAVQMTKTEQDLVGQKILNKAIMPPSVPLESLKNSQVPWPRIDPDKPGGRQNRAIRLLSMAFAYQPDRNDTDIVDINLILQQAFYDLVSQGVLLQADAAVPEYRLDLTKTGFSLITKAWKCPVTNRLLDTTLKGITPYASSSATSYMAEPVDMPLYSRPLVDVGGLASRLAHARSWLEGNATVQVLREEFYWSDLSDGVIEYTDFFNAREHSAQVGQQALKRIVEGFDKGTVNFLSCSTTMEMGVDLSGFNTVMNNNVPPHPANYLQRAGRAGRRRESQAVVMTVARNTPHDQGVFMNPLWAFEKRVSVPAVRFDSEDLVLRHISSWLLGRFLRQQQLAGSSTTLTTAGFLLAAGRPEPLVDVFIGWIKESVKPQGGEDEVKSVIRLISAGTALQGFSAASIVQRIATLYSDLCTDWNLTRFALMRQLAGLLGTETPSIEFTEGAEPPVSALRRQISRLDGEFLLKELAAKKVLPTFGFPSDIVTFNNENIEDFLRGRGARGDVTTDREDSLLRKNGLPSRSRPIAIREYAPGNELVIDGKVFKSAGLTLNWKVPAQQADELREEQQLKFAWRCHSCGASDSSVSYPPSHCTQCSEMLRPSNIQRYIVPNGFAVDFAISPTMNIEDTRQVPLREPWLSVNEPWVPLGTGLAGSVRRATNAHLFSFSDGLHQNGYALCLQCGRMDSMGPADSSDPNGQDAGRYLPDVFRRQHKKLRGGKKKGRGAESYCEASEESWKVLSRLSLGHDTKTAAVELALRLPDGGAVHDSTVAYTVGLALRNVIAEEFGVIPDEMGVSTKEIRIGDEKFTLAQVFDVGSGAYSTSFSGLHKPQTWQKVRSHLANCPGGCPSACFNCLLTFENRFKADSIDRMKGLEVITDKWIEAFNLPAEIAALNAGFEFVSSEPLAWLREKIDRGAKATIYLGGHPDLWDLSLATNLRILAESAAASSRGLELCLGENVPKQLDEGNAFQLLEVIGNHPSVTLLITDKDPTISRLGNWRIFGQVEEDGNKTVLLSSSKDAVVPDWRWGSSVGCGVVIAGSPLDLHVGVTSRNLGAQAVRPGTVFLQDELDGRVDGFGLRFWNLLIERHPVVSNLFSEKPESVASIEYSDRYFRSPLVMALFCEVLSGMKQLGLAGDDAIKVVVRVRERGPSDKTVSSQVYPFHDFSSDSKLCSVLEKALRDCGFNPDVDIRSSIEHCRV